MVEEARLVRVAPGQEMLRLATLAYNFHTRAEVPERRRRRPDAPWCPGANGPLRSGRSPLSPTAGGPRRLLCFDRMIRAATSNHLSRERILRKEATMISNEKLVDVVSVEDSAPANTKLPVK